VGELARNALAYSIPKNQPDTRVTKNEITEPRLPPNALIDGFITLHMKL